MAISILPPAPPPAAKPSSRSRHHKSTGRTRDDSDSDSDSDTEMLEPSRTNAFSLNSIVTPGETITSDPQFMRGHGTFVPASSSSSSSSTENITASLVGTLTRTNKLLSITPLRARYTPEIGDLVIGRIVDVQARRWKVDVGAPLLASLPLSAVNLPGGILRRRTSTDELQMRSFFAEGDLVMAEVQAVHGDGAAGLHTRSERYGKLRNGLFLSVGGGAGGGRGGVVRGRRQLWTVSTPGRGRGGHSDVGVVLGVNGFVWIAKHNAAAAPALGRDSEMGEADERGGGGGGGGGGAGGLANSTFSSQNSAIAAETRREIARLAGCIRALVAGGIRVEERTVMAAYEACLEIEAEEAEEGEEEERGGGSVGGGGGGGGGDDAMMMVEGGKEGKEGREGSGGGSSLWLGGEKGERVLAMVLQAVVTA